MITVNELRTSLLSIQGDWLIEQSPTGNIVFVEPKTKAWIGAVDIVTGAISLFTEGEGE